jgi:hypothetical protein
MDTTTKVATGPDGLRGIGRPDPSGKWLDYVDRFGMSAAHVPTLVRMSLDWVDAPFNDKVADWAPVHALRALGQLRAIEALEPLLGLLDELEEADDDWFLEDMPSVFSSMGPAAIEALTRYICDPEHGVYARIVVGDGLCKLGESHPNGREGAVLGLRTGLAGFRRNDPAINGFLISSLLTLGAANCAELIERAFVAGRVDESIVGDWRSVRRELAGDRRGGARAAVAKDKPSRIAPSPRDRNRERRRNERRSRRRSRTKR